MNACFVSYRHAGLFAQEIVEAFCEKLNGQLSLYVPGAKIYMDTKRLQAGDFFDLELATQLCSSCCMIVLYNPEYFSTDYRYCAREYYAMVQLEEMRLSATPAEHRSKGLIIPVVIRGADTLPPDVRKRQYVSFEKDLLIPADFRKRTLLHKVHEIARSIYDRYQLYRRFHPQAFDDCGEFQIPGDEDIEEWLGEMLSPEPSLPGS